MIRREKQPFPGSRLPVGRGEAQTGPSAPLQRCTSHRLARGASEWLWRHTALGTRVLPLLPPLSRQSRPLKIRRPRSRRGSSVNEYSLSLDLRNRGAREEPGLDRRFPPLWLSSAS